MHVSTVEQFRLRDVLMKSRCLAAGAVPGAESAPFLFISRGQKCIFIVQLETSWFYTQSKQIFFFQINLIHS